MRVLAKFIDAEELSVSLTITMTLGQWKALRAVLPNSHPAWPLEQHISKAVRRLESAVEEDDITI